MGWAIAVHGGGGNIPVDPVDFPPEKRVPREAALRHCLAIGTAALEQGRSPLDVVELVVRELENHPMFNAGRGSALTADGTVEMEASIMESQTMNCGAVSGLKTVVNPVSLARLVMEKTPHVFLAFDGAEAFAREQGVETAELNYFVTPENIEKLRKANEAKRAQEPNMDNGDSKFGTVGCVAVDSNGNMAAATSTGGPGASLQNKMAGRIGDTPIIGAGTYANSYCAVSTTGIGEPIIKGTIARDVAAVMEFKGLPLKEAAAYVVEKAQRGTVGLIAVSPTGEVAMPFNTPGMFRACATQDGHSEIAIH